MKICISVQHYKEVGCFMVPCEFVEVAISLKQFLCAIHKIKYLAISLNATFAILAISASCLILLIALAGML